MVVAGAVTYKFTVDEYHRMAEAGVFHEDDRIELVEGEIIRMAAIGNRHLGTVNRLNAIFAQLTIGDRATVSVQNPVRLNDRSEPQPDLTLLTYSDDAYSRRMPLAGDVLLLVEVADSSLDYDRLAKIPLYARSGISETWLIDLTRDRIEVYREPHLGSYASVDLRSRDDSLSPLAFPEITVKVSDVIIR